MLKKFVAAIASVAAIIIGVTGVGVAFAPAASAAYTVCNSKATSYDAYGHYIIAPGVNGRFGVTCYMAIGDTGAGVEVLQRTLNKCYGKSLVPDGIFGTLTKNALISAQAAAGIPTPDRDGEYGPQTRDALKWRHYRDSDGRFIYCSEPDWF